jgi:DNA polymerase III delta subunit
MSQWRQPPPVVVLSGAEEFLRQRELREAISIADETGRSVEYIKGGDNEELLRTISSTGVLYEESVLLVIEEDFDEIDVELVLRHHEFGSDSVCVLLHHPGAIKAKSRLAKIAEDLPPRLVAKFEKPKPWEEAAQATSFCANEAQRHGVKLSAPLAEALVQHVGTDLGMLSFEILKLRVLLAAEGGSEVTAVHLRNTVAAFAEIGPKPIVDALEVRDVRALGQALANVRRTHAGDIGGATLRTCGFVGHSATSWLHTAALLRSGRSAEEIAEKLGQHLFIVRKTTLPAARRWGEGKLTRLVKSLVRVSNAVKGGHANPWVELECALFRSLTDGGE